MSIAAQIQSIRKTLSPHTTLVAVSKTKPMEMIQEAYAVDQRDFGENKVQELVDKHAGLPKDIKWHMIGHLQRNKVKYIAPFVHLIHGVDTIKLLKEINKEGKKNDRIISCLLQVHIAEEQTKFGFDITEIEELLSPNTLDDFSHIMIEGLMGMATNTTDKAQVASEFAQLKRDFDHLKSEYTHSCISFNTLSMGMSGDYELAIANGSTMVRVGSTIFGARNYDK